MSADDVTRDPALESLLTEAQALAESDVKAGRDQRVPWEMPAHLSEGHAYDHYSECWETAFCAKELA